MSAAGIKSGYSNTPCDRISITISMFLEIGWTKERVLDRINQWLTAMTLTGHWWEQTDEWQARLYESMRRVWEEEFNGCNDF